MSPGRAQGVLDGFPAAIYVSLVAAVLGVAATALRGHGGRLVLSRA